MPKRKRGQAYRPDPDSPSSTPARSTKRKRGRASNYQEPSSPASAQHPHGAIDTEKEYRVRSILAETKTKYHIDWEDDTETGEVYEPSWEPKANANAEAVEDWEGVKAAKAASLKGETAGGSGKGKSPAVVKEPAKRRGRPRKVIESSPEPGPVPEPVAADVEEAEPSPDPESQRELLEIDDSQQAAPGAGRQVKSRSQSPLFVSADASPEPDRASRAPTATVQVPDPPSSFADGGYDRFSFSQRKGVERTKNAQTQSQSVQGAQNSNETTDNTTSEIIVQKRKPSPEPSQYVPDPADTSKSTNETTDVSARPSTPSQQIQEELREVGETVVITVPDSQIQTQSLPDSSSFVPRSTQGESSLETSGEVVRNQENSEQVAEGSQRVQGTQIESVPSAEVTQLSQQIEAEGTDQDQAAEQSNVRESSQAPSQTANQNVQSESQHSAASSTNQLQDQQQPPASTADDIDDFFAGAISSTNPSNLQGRTVPEEAHIAPANSSIEPSVGDQVNQEPVALQGQSQQSDSQDLYRSSVSPRRRFRSPQAETLTGATLQEKQGQAQLQSQASAAISEDGIQPQSQLGDSQGVDHSSAPYQHRSASLDAQSQFVDPTQAPKQSQAQLQSGVRAATQEEGQILDQRAVAPLGFFKQFHARSSNRIAAEEPQDLAAPIAHSDPVLASYQFQSQEQATHSSDQRRHSASHPISISSGQPTSSESAFNQRLASLIASGTSVQANILGEQSQEAPQAAQAEHGDIQFSDQSQELPLVGAAGVTSHRPAAHDIPSQSIEGLDSPSFPFSTQIRLSSRAGDPSAHRRALFLGHNSQPSPITQQRRQHHSVASSHRAASQPQDTGTSPTPLSSPFASIPSYPPPPIGESAPPRPRTPSTLDVGNMQSSPQPPLSIAAKLKAMREANAARRASTPASVHNAQAIPEAGRPKAVPPRLTSPVPLSALPARLTSPAPAEGARSPSAVPAMEPPPVVTREDQATSERYPTLVPQAHANRDDTMAHDGDTHNNSTASNDITDATMADAPDQGGKVHLVPIALHGTQRDQYPTTVWYSKDLIDKYLATDAPDADLTEKAEEFVRRMKRVVNHPDLDNDETLTQYDVSPERQAEWDIQCSAKFRFLRELVSYLENGADAGNTVIKIALLTSNTRMASMLFNLCKTLPVRAVLEPGEEHEESIGEIGNLTIVISSSSRPLCLEDDGVGYVIAFDNGIEQDSPIRQIASYTQRKPLGVVMQLVVPLSVEHIERRLAPTLSNRARLSALLSGTFKLRSEAGALEADQVPLSEAALAIADYMLNPDKELVEWPLATLSRLDQLDSQTESDINASISENMNATYTQEDAHTGEKRGLNAADFGIMDSDPSKRLRTDAAMESSNGALPTTINLQELDLSRVSDSVNKPTQADPSTSSATSTAPKDEKARLRRELQETQARLDDHIKDLSDLQYRHEDQRNELIKVTTERDNAISTAQALLVRREDQDALVKTLRAERIDLNAKLGEVNARLLSHAIPEVAELEAVRVAKEKAEKDNERLQNRLEAANRELEYMRTNYQDASSAAQGLRQENKDMENELAVAQNKATGTQVELKQMGMDTFTKKLRDENRRLKATLTNRDAGLQTRDEEIARLKEASRGRMGTRGTSVPRSPRMGSPLKMATGSGGGGGGGSRQGSPSASFSSSPSHVSAEGVDLEDDSSDEADFELNKTTDFTTRTAPGTPWDTSTTPTANDEPLIKTERSDDDSDYDSDDGGVPVGIPLTAAGAPLSGGGGYYTLTGYASHSHQMSMTTAQSHPFACKQCPRRCRTSKRLNRHIRAVHHQGIKPFICNNCGRRFALLSYFKQHVNEFRCHNYVNALNAAVAGMGLDEDEDDEGEGEDDQDEDDEV